MSEREVQHDPQVLEGEDEVPRQPLRRPIPTRPSPVRVRGDRRAFRVLPWAWLVVAIVVALVIWALFR